MAHICKYYNWDKVAAVSSNDLYGSTGNYNSLSELYFILIILGIQIFLKEAATLNISIVSYQSITDNNIEDIISALQGSKVKIFILFSSDPSSVIVEARYSNY
jgi:hypothetical protein